MKGFIPRAALLVLCSGALVYAVTSVGEPLWAYGFAVPPPPNYQAPPPGSPPVRKSPAELGPEFTRPRQAAGSVRKFSLDEIGDPTNTVDWFPRDHPPMPEVVRQGSPAAGTLRRSCAYCHLTNGKGRPENASLAGLPPAYFIRQLRDFRDGLRRSADPRKLNTNTMIALAGAMTDAEMQEAADYFAVQPASPWIRVVETDLVPRTRFTPGRMFSPVETERTEPIGQRIVEVPEDVEQVEELENPRIGFVAYVPVGSIRRGEILATTGGSAVVGGASVPGRTVACVACHGPELRGVGEIPGIAGRSPSYIARQLFDIRQGTRKAPLSQLMLPAVTNLTEADIIDLAAYVSSLGAAR